MSDGRDPPQPPQPARRLEQHLQTVLISLTTAAVAFTANYVYNDNRQKAVQQTQLELLTAQVIEMRADLRVLQKENVSREQVRDLEQRVRELEKRGGMR